jgi:hypothetical protein
MELGPYCKRLSIKAECGRKFWGKDGSVDIWGAEKVEVKREESAEVVEFARS